MSLRALDEPYSLPDDPFDADWSQRWDVEPAPPPFLEIDTLPDEAVEVPPHDERWAWHDARLIGVYREGTSAPYEVGAVDLYAEPEGHDLSGSYLPLAAFSEEAVAVAYYADLQSRIDEDEILPSALPDYLGVHPQKLDPEAAWRPASRDEIAAYEFTRDLELYASGDIPPLDFEDPLLALEARLGAGRERTDTFHEEAAFHALRQIGVEAEGLGTGGEAPPFYDEETDTAYWIGVFQPDRDDPDHCVTSILSLSRTESGYEAQLAPCVPGSWEKAYNAAEFLIAQAHKGGIERAFSAAEGMALATDQRTLWEQERGLALDDTAARDLADYAAGWEIDR